MIRLRVSLVNPAWAGLPTERLMALVRLPNGTELTIDGRAPVAGQVFRNPGLARTFRKIAESGKTAFFLM